MLGRIMIGKVPEAMGMNDVAAVLREVPLPDGVEDPVAWIQAAIVELQDVGCAERFSVEAFMSDAMGHAGGWHAKNKREPEKVNYTWSRTFP